MKHKINTCEQCEEQYCVKCSDAPKQYRENACSQLCYERLKSEYDHTAENERLEGVSFDKQRLEAK